MWSKSQRFILLAGVLVVSTMLAGGCGSSVASTLRGIEGGSIGEEYDLSDATLSVGSKEFTEQLILGNITKLALQAAGADVRDQIGLASSSAAREALKADYIDMYWEYTGTGWITHLQNTKPLSSRQAQFEAVKEADLEENNIVWVSPPAPANNTYAIAVRKEAYEELGVKKLSDFPQLVNNRPDAATFCVASEFANRDDGLPGMEEAYGFEFPDNNVSLLALGVIYQSVDQGDPCNFGEVFQTDGRIAALDLKLIEDDKKFFAPYNPALIMRQEAYEEYPQIKDLMAPITKKLDTETLRNLNRKVDVDGSFPDVVAEEWLRENGFIGG